MDWFKYDWYWRKPKGTGFLNARKQPLRDIETISIFYEKQCLYNPQYEKGEPYKPHVSKKSRVRNATVYGKFIYGKDSCNSNDGFRYPKQILEFNVENGRILHPTQKPVKLLEYLIKTYTNEGDTVLDNCMGSGSTGIACQNLKRNFIGIEKDSDYFAIAEKRLKNNVDIFEV